MEFDFRLFTTTIVAIINALGVGLIFLAYSSESETRIRRIFIQMTVIMLAWVNFAYLARVPQQEELSLLWIRIAWALTPTLMVLIYFFAKSFSQKVVDPLYKLFFIVIGLSYLVVTLFTGLIIESVNFDQQGILQISYGNFALSYFALIFFLIIIGISVLIKELYKTRSDEKKKKIKYILIGMGFFLLMNFIFNMYLPYFKNTFNLYFFGDYSTSIFLIFVAYATIKHKLFNTKIFATETLVFLIWTAFSLKLFWSSGLFDRVLNLSLFVLSIIFGIFLINSVRKEIEQREQLEEAYKKLQRLDKTKTEFMSIISHQLRTPLSIIKGHLSMIKEGVYDKEKEREKKIINNVYDANERLITLVNDVLNISRIQSGRVDINKEKADLKKVVKNVVGKLRPSAEDKGIKLTVHRTEDKLDEIKIDVSKIENVLLNLIDNAIKYTTEGSIEIYLKRDNGFARIEIKDTGDGMSQEELDKLFESFSRGSAGKAHWVQGSGLGLHIARRFTEMHNGEVWAESEGKGKGSTFYIKLPV